MLPTARKLQNLDPSTVIGEVPLLDSDKTNVTEIVAPEAAVQDGAQDGVQGDAKKSMREAY